jgi:hypothetical protein
LQSAAAALLAPGAFVACHAGPGDLQHIKEEPWEPATGRDAALYAAIRGSVSASAASPPAGGRASAASTMPPGCVARTVTFSPAPAHTSALGSALTNKAALFVKVKERTVGPVGALVGGGQAAVPPPFLLATAVSLSAGGGPWVTFMHHTITVDAGVVGGGGGGGGGCFIQFCGAPVLPRWVGGPLKTRGAATVESLFTTSAAQALAWLGGLLGEGEKEGEEVAAVVEAGRDGRPSSASSLYGHGGGGGGGSPEDGRQGAALPAKVAASPAPPRRYPALATLGACFAGSPVKGGGSGSIQEVVTVDGDRFWDAAEE